MSDEAADKLTELRSPQRDRRHPQGSSSESGSGQSGDSGRRSLESRLSTVSTDGPTEEELKWYFYGLPTNVKDEYAPKFVARSSQEPFSGLWNDESEGQWRARLLKNVFNVGKHPIVYQYDTGIRERIRATLQGIKWISINVVRIGYSDLASDNPVTILITVEPSSVMFGRAHDIVTRAHEILKR